MKRRRPPSLPFAVLAAFASTAVLSVAAQATDDVLPRWDQASFLISPSSSPLLAFISGKAYVAGQTYSSTPTTSTSVFLDLSKPILDLSSAPFLTTTPTNGPIVSSASAAALSSTTSLLFGGDATGDLNFPLQTSNDSAWLLSSSSSIYAFSTAHQGTSWFDEPERRQNTAMVSATNGTMSRVWVLGGLRADGSGLAFDELWEFGIGVDAATGRVSTTDGIWGLCGALGGPGGTWDGQGVVVENPAGDPVLYFLGGATSSFGTSSLNPLSTIYVYTPSPTTLFEGAWSTLVVPDGGYVPAPRRGFVALGVGDGKIWIQGGRDLDSAQVFSDAAVLDTKSGTWTEASDDGVAVWGHSGAMVGLTAVLAFGYGLNSPGSTDLRVYSPANDTWLTAYYPSYDELSASMPGSGASNPTISTTDSIGATDALSTGPSVTATQTTPMSPTSLAWTVPGAAVPIPTSSSKDAGAGALVSTSSSSSINGVSSSTSSPSSTSTSTPGAASSKVAKKIAGAVVGSFALVALVAIGGVLFLRRRRRRRPGMEGYSTASRQRRMRGGGGFGGGDGSGSLIMVERDYDGSMSSPQPIQQTNPVMLRGVGNSPAERRSRLGRALSGFWSGSTGAAAPDSRRRRLDMLNDEGSQGWTFFDDRDTEIPEMTGRGGMGVWNGYRDATGRKDASGGSARSFLTAALGAFTPPSRTLVEDFHDPLTPSTFEDDLHTSDLGRLGPISEEWDDDDDHDHPRTASGGTSSLDLAETVESGAPSSRGAESSDVPSLPTTTSGSTSFGSSPAPASPSGMLPLSGGFGGFGRRSPPFGKKSASLYGPAFGKPSGASDESAGAASAPGLRRNSTWWTRFSNPLGGTGVQETEYDRIRDPAPPPSLQHFHDNDPFTDAAASSVDDHGRLLVDSSGGQQRKRRDSSLSTVASYALEEAMLGMDVVQRQATVSSTGHSTLSSSEGQEDAIIWTGAAVLPRRAQSPEVFDSDERDTFVTAPSTVPAAVSRNRFREPRPFDAGVEAQSGSPPPASPTAQKHASSTGVKAIVQQFERRSSLLVEPTSPSASSSPAPLSPVEMPRSASLVNVQKAKLEFDRPRVMSASALSDKGKAVRHGLAKKQLLYVANPDETASDGGKPVTESLKKDNGV